MAINTLHQESQPEFAQVARRCGMKGIRIVATGVAMLALLGNAIDHWTVVVDVWSAVWATVVWALSVGGYFWGGISMGSLALCVSAWASCVDAKLRPEKSQSKTLLFWVCAVTLVLWVMASITLQWTYVSFDDLNTHQQIAVVAIYAPYFLIYLIILGHIHSPDESGEQPGK